MAATEMEGFEETWELTEEQFRKKFIVKPRKVLQVGFLTG